MKQGKQDKGQKRILGRQLARELTQEDLDQVSGGLISDGGGTSTWTTSNPADGPYNDNGGGGPVST